jgi:hypothetical protein
VGFALVRLDVQALPKKKRGRASVCVPAAARSLRQPELPQERAIARSVAEAQPLIVTELHFALGFCVALALVVAAATVRPVAPPRAGSAARGFPRRKELQVAARPPGLQLLLVEAVIQWPALATLFPFDQLIFLLLLAGGAELPLPTTPNGTIETALRSQKQFFEE